MKSRIILAALLLLPAAAFAVDKTVADLDARGTLAATDVIECEATAVPGSYKCTLAEVQTFVLAGIDTEAELEAKLSDVANMIVSTEIDSEAELEALLADVTNVITDSESAASAVKLDDADYGDISSSGGTITVDIDFEEEGTINTTVITGNAADNYILIGSGASAATWGEVPDCTTGVLQYDDATNAVSCGAVGASQVTDDVACTADQYLQRNATDTGWECDAGGAPGADTIGTSQLNDNADTPAVNELIRVDSVDTADIEYGPCTMDDNGAIDCPAPATAGGSLTVKEGQDDGSNKWIIKAPDTGLSADKTCTLNADGTVPVDCLETQASVIEVCIPMGDTALATDAEWYTVWRAPAALTISEIYCEVTGGTSILFDFEIDDGTPTGVNGSNITCTTSGVTDATLAGDTTMAANDRLDIDFGTETGTNTQASFCIKATYD